jgi:hypothetical protein
MTSTDGVTWTARSAAEANYWFAVTYGNGVFVAVAAYSGANRVMTSPDGVTWTARTAASVNNWNSVTYGNGVFVALTSAWTNQVMTSTDGVTWTARTTAESGSWNSVTYGNGVFVAVGSTGSNRVMTSSLAEPAAPAAPRSLVATPGNGSASIAFVAGADGGAAISKYQYSIDGGSNWSDAAAGNASPVTVNSLTNGTNYSITLRAVNSLGGGTASSAVSVTPCTTPAAPTSLVATAGDGSVSIAFTGGADGGAAISKYQYSIDGGSNWSDADAGTTSPVTVSGLTNYSDYRFELRAVNSAGAGAASVATGTVTPAVTAPTPCSATALGSTRIQVCWNLLSPTRGQVVRYRAFVSLSGTGTRKATCKGSALETTCVVKGRALLTASTAYDVRVRARIKLAQHQVIWTLLSALVQVTTLP